MVCDLGVDFLTVRSHRSWDFFSLRHFGLTNLLMSKRASLLARLGFSDLKH